MLNDKLENVNSCSYGIAGNDKDFMEIEVYNPLNYGFYGYSVLNPSEEGNNLENTFEIDLESVDYDFKSYKQNVSIDVNYLMVDLLNDAVKELDLNLTGCNLLDSDLRNHKLFSPKYYNYGSDMAYFNVLVLKSDLKLFIDFVFNRYELELKESIKKEFTSYDGFLSYHSNDYKQWYKDLISFESIDCLNDSKFMFKVGWLFCFVIKQFNTLESLNNQLYEICMDIMPEVLIYK